MDKKTIKIKYCKYAGRDETTPLTFNFFVNNLLKKHYNVVPTDKDPDFLFFHEAAREHLDYDCVKIFNTGENISPDFNVTDYAVGIEWMTFEDRYFRLPPYFAAAVYTEKDIALAENFDPKNPKPFTKEDLDKKTEFCSFVYSNYLADKRREVLLKTINTYKKVNSGGRYLNNIGGPVVNKVEFEMKHKFSMAIENSCRNGYTTDRIVNGFMANTIPIYWGNPAIGKEFNTKRFINCHEYNNFEEVLERIKEIDADDDLYLQIMNEPIFADGFDFESTEKAFEVFLQSIFNQDKETARRRTINPVHAKKILEKEKRYAKILEQREVWRSFLSKLYSPFKKISLLEKYKRSYFRKKLH